MRKAFTTHTQRFGLVYGYADLGRAGLGNMLFPWARCLLWCQRHQVPMLPPRWLRLRIGPLLRGEPDRRMYHRLFRGPGKLRLAYRTACLLALPRRQEPGPDEPPAPAGGGVYVFRGMNGFFAPLIGEQRLIARTLEAWLKPEYVPPAVGRREIAVHVRRGDFGRPPSDQHLREGHQNTQIPLEWYVRTLRAIRSGLGAPISARVFSDGNPNELRELLAEPGTSLRRAVSVATDLLAMSQAATLVASGSTFSRWATFLGQVPSVWHPGQRSEPVLQGDAALTLAPEWDGGPLSDAFLRTVQSRLQRPSEDTRAAGQLAPPPRH